MKVRNNLMARLGGNMRESMASARPAQGPDVTPAAAALHGGAPTKYQGAARVKDALSIEIDRIIPDPNQPRRHFDPDSLAELAASLKDKGQLQAALVRWDDDAGKWALIAGERRYRAALLAGLPVLNCVELKADLSLDDRLEIQLIENALREDLDDVEQAAAYRALMDRRGWSQRQIAENLHIAASSIARALALLELPADVQAQVAAGDLAPSVAYEVAKIEDASTQREVASRIVAEKMTRDEAVAEVRAVIRPKAPRGAKGRGANKVRPTRPRTFRLSMGKVTVEPGKKATGPKAMLAMIEEVASVLRGEIGGVEQEAA